MKNEIVKINAQEFGLEQKQVISVDQAFAEKIKERELLSEIYGQLIKKDINKEVASEARAFRLKAVKTKTGIASIHQSQKEYALAYGKYCDKWKRKETEPIQQMIDGAMDIEKFEEIQERARIAELQEKRQTMLFKYESEMSIPNLGEMTTDVWTNYIAGVKLQLEVKIEAEKKAEEERIEVEKKIEDARIEKEKNEKIHEDRKLLLIPYWNFVPVEYKDDDFSVLTIHEFEERLNWSASEKEKDDKKQAEIKAENQRLKKASELKEKTDKIETKKREKIEADRIAKEQKEKRIREAKERIATEEAALKLKLKEAERELLEAKLKAKQEAEDKAKQEAESYLQAELSKGDAAKIIDLIIDLKALKGKYTFKSEASNKMYEDVGNLIDKVINHINK